MIANAADGGRFRKELGNARWRLMADYGFPTVVVREKKALQ
jgi:hypothetical protein